MCSEDVIIADVKGVNGNQSDAQLENSMDFYPLVYFSLSFDNSVTAEENSIFKYVPGFYNYKEEYSPYVLEMEYPQLPEGKKYFVNYLRMWPSQIEDRIFKLACKVTSGQNNCSTEGNIYVELPNPINGLNIQSPNDGVSNVAIDKSFTVELSITKDVDRTLKQINAVPLVFYVLNNGTPTEVGRIHLSIAPKDVFSDGEIKLIHESYQSTRKENYEKLYELTGGEVLKMFNRERIRYEDNFKNTCAIRLSRALNGAGLYIKSGVKYSFEGADGNGYFVNAEYMYAYLEQESMFGKAKVLLEGETLENAVYFQQVLFNNASGHIDYMFDGKPGIKFYDKEGTNYYWEKDPQYKSWESEE